MIFQDRLYEFCYTFPEGYRAFPRNSTILIYIFLRFCVNYNVESRFFLKILLRDCIQPDELRFHSFFIYLSSPAESIYVSCGKYQTELPEVSVAKIQFSCCQDLIISQQFVELIRIIYSNLPSLGLRLPCINLLLFVLRYIVCFLFCFVFKKLLVVSCLSSCHQAGATSFTYLLTFMRLLKFIQQYQFQLSVPVCVTLFSVSQLIELQQLRILT